MATITLEFNMAGSVFQDLGLGTLTPNMDDQIGVGMEREVAGLTMSTECQDAVDTKPIPVSVVCHLRTAGDDTVAVLELKTAEPGAQSHLIITGTNCGGTAEAERNLHQLE